ncbi:MAG: hypothetical protein ACLFNT_06335 [Spirochaetales bacterium]
MTVDQLRDEFDLSVDDIRWYCSHTMMERILDAKDDPDQIVHRIWSGRLEAELYQMEERFLKQLQDELERDLIDERHIREHFDRARLLKMRRH